MRILKYVLSLLLIFLIAGCCHGYKKLATPYGVMAVPNCCPSIKYTGNSVTVSGVSVNVPANPISIGGVTVEPKTIQTACDIVQILEQHRLDTCSRLPSYACISKRKFAAALDAMQKDSEVLAQFAMVISSKDGEAIREFVKAYAPQVKDLKTPEEPAQEPEEKKMNIMSYPEQREPRKESVTPVAWSELIK